MNAMTAREGLSNTSSYVPDCWYVVAWDYELPVSKAISRQLLEQQLVLYRNVRGEVVALEDRCVHRFAPLSLGRIEGDDIRCLYHGLKFGPTGRCVEIPNQDLIPERAAVRSYPVIERESWIWVWMGAPAAADPALIPQTVGLQHPDWRMKSGQMDIEANWELLNDNLCDLSHLAYVHPATLGRGAPSWADSLPVTTRLPRGIRSERWLPGSKIPGPDGKDVAVDQWNSYDFLAPGIFLLENRSYPDGTAARLDFKAPGELEPITALFSTQAVSPISERLTRYFYSIGPSARTSTPHQIDAIFRMAEAAFEEDRVMETAQQRILDRDPSRRMLTISTDLALNAMRKIMREIASSEGSAVQDQQVREQGGSQ